MEPKYYAKKFPEVANFFGGYFHQDWIDLQGSSDWRPVVRAYCQTVPLEERSRVTRELSDFLRLDLDEHEVDTVLGYQFGCAYYAPAGGITYWEWLEQLYVELVRCDS
ncbi:MAG: contact-dependent growth inhibition system immunity protein [Chloroflexota bacterium]